MNPSTAKIFQIRLTNLWIHVHCTLFLKYWINLCTGWPVNKGRVFLVPWKKWLVQCTHVQWRTLDKSLYTRYQINTAMFNWSPCIIILYTPIDTLYRSLSHSRITILNSLRQIQRQRIKGNRSSEQSYGSGPGNFLPYGSGPEEKKLPSLY